MIIQETDKYDKFKYFYDSNRIVHDSKPSPNLLESIKKKNLLHLHPIIVDSEYRIIDGQNRLACARLLKLPIYFLKCDKIQEEDIPLCQVQRPWELKDFLRFFNYINDYAILKAFYADFKFPLMFLIKKCCGKLNVNKLFRKGEFRLSKDKEYLKIRLHYLSATYDICKTILNGKEINVNGLDALWSIVSKDKYDPARFTQKLQSNWDDVANAFKFRTTANIGNALKELYNKSLPKESRETE